ncbi:MAG TPA: class I SAM-dependent methyltransferase, partial [Ilumatobacteraceae bacterium]|nr:class I SAM-dependent methyltransferase [Ilumatobacteraceae bacterium]
HWWYAATRQLLADLVRPRLPAVRHDSLYLDAAGGVGGTARWLTTLGTTVLADIEPTALASVGPGVIPELADIGALPHPDATFDAVICVTALYHQLVPDPGAVVTEFARVTRPGGVVCLMEPGVRRMFRAHDRATHGARRFSRSDLRRLAENAGLQVQRATGAYSFLIPPAAISAVLERGKSTSDVSRNQSGLGGVLGRIASVERRLLARINLPVGLSVITIARRPMSCDNSVS